MAGSLARVTTPSTARYRSQRSRARGATRQPVTTRADLHRTRTRAHVTGGSQPAATPVVARYLMGARLAAGGAWITWAVTGAPDLAGAQAPSAVQGGTVAVVHRWTA